MWALTQKIFEMTPIVKHSTKWKMLVESLKLSKCWVFFKWTWHQSVTAEITWVYDLWWFMQCNLKCEEMQRLGVYRSLSMFISGNPWKLATSHFARPSLPRHHRALLPAEGSKLNSGDHIIPEVIHHQVIAPTWIMLNHVELDDLWGWSSEL